MRFVDFQVHLPTDREKGDYLGQQKYQPGEWAQELAPKSEELYIVPTVTNREYTQQDKEYIDAAQQQEQIEVLGRGIEIDSGRRSINIISQEPDINFFEDAETKYELVYAAEQHLEEQNDSFALLSHPFSKDGGLLRDSKPRSYEVQALSDMERLAGDHQTNAWLETFRKQPWKTLNHLDDDRFGLKQEYSDLELEIPDIASSDIKDPGLAGTSRNPLNREPESPIDAYQQARQNTTQVNQIPTSIMLRKLGSGIPPIKNTYEKIINQN